MVIYKVECFGIDGAGWLFFAFFCGVALIVSNKDISYTGAGLLGLA
ncbi:MAG: hypothetical protein WC256_06850 [Desulfurivibrionaceae bacterium]|jgi:hypothetical protein